MKEWTKILMWIGLGGGIGFFAGYQAGHKVGSRDVWKQIEYKDAENEKVLKRAFDNGYDAGYFRGCLTANNERYSNAEEALKDYAGNPEPEEDPPMVEEPPTIGDEAEIEEIPQPHPQHLIPELISEEEYYDNPWGYDQESLIFYELDEVLFNKDTRKALTSKDEQEQVVGIGTLFGFYLKDGETLDAIFVKNDTMGTIFRIDRMEAAYIDEGADPEYEEEDLD